MIFKCFHKLSTNKTRNRAWKQCCHFRDPPVQEMPVQSMITHPSPHDVIAAVKSGCEYTDITQCLIKTQDTTNIVVWPIEPIWESFHILKYQMSWTIFYSLIITSTDDIQTLFPGYNSPDPRSQHHSEGYCLGGRGPGHCQGGCQCGRRRTLHQVSINQSYNKII